MTKTERSERNANRVRCLGCRRWLKAKASVAAQRGPKCLAKYNARLEASLASLDLSTYTSEQIVKAAELIAENAIVERLVIATGGRVYLAVASDGSQWYTTSRFSCTCKAGQYGRTCYHRLAATVLDAVAAV